jgi:hypothetical protein
MIFVFMHETFMKKIAIVCRSGQGYLRRPNGRHVLTFLSRAILNSFSVILTNQTHADYQFIRASLLTPTTQRFHFLKRIKTEICNISLIPGSLAINMHHASARSKGFQDSMRHRALWTEGLNFPRGKTSR